MLRGPWQRVGVGGKAGAVASGGKRKSVGAKGRGGKEKQLKLKFTPKTKTKEMRTTTCGRDHEVIDSREASPGRDYLQKSKDIPPNQ